MMPSRIQSKFGFLLALPLTFMPLSATADEKVGQWVQVNPGIQLNLRAQPQPASEILGQVNAADALQLLAVEAGFYHVQDSEGRLGWVSREWSQASLFERPDQPTRVVVNEGVRLNLRSHPGISSEVLGQVTSDIQLELLGLVQDFAKVVDDQGQEGWVSQRFIQLIPVELVEKPAAEQVGPTSPPESLDLQEVFMASAEQDQPTSLTLEVKSHYQQLALDVRSFVHLALMRNPELIINDLNKEVARQQQRHAQGAYEAELFASLSYEDRETKNSPFGEEVIDTGTLIDRQGRLQTGVRKLVRSGAEVTLSYDARKRENNISSAMDGPDGLDDNIGSLNLSVRQPLFRGWGAAQVEGRIRQAEHQVQIAQEQLRQLMLGKTYDTIDLYWQLYREERLHQLSQESLERATELLADIERRVQAGRLPETALQEARSVYLLREAQIFSAQRTRDQVLADVMSFLDMSALDGNPEILTTSEPDTHRWQAPVSFDAYLQQVMHTWPQLQIARQRIAVEEQNRRIARDELKPRLDLLLGYGVSSRRFDSDYGRTFEDAFSTDYPYWSLGLEFSMPLGGNQSARARREIAELRVHQAQLQQSRQKLELTNQLKLRMQQIDAAHEEVMRLKDNVGYLQHLLAVEQERFNRGLSPVMDLIEREDNLNAGLVRKVNAQIRHEMARAALQLSDGSLLNNLGVTAQVEVDQK